MVLGVVFAMHSMVSRPDANVGCRALGYPGARSAESSARYVVQVGIQGFGYSCLHNCVCGLSGGGGVVGGMTTMVNLRIWLRKFVSVFGMVSVM